jgi:hypothetical protein
MVISNINANADAAPITAIANAQEPTSGVRKMRMAWAFCTDATTAAACRRIAFGAMDPAVIQKYSNARAMPDAMQMAPDAIQTRKRHAL